MSESKPQDVLNRILRDLKSDDPNDQLSAIRELEKTSYSSPAIVERLEKLAIHGKGAVQNFALEALKLETSQHVASRRPEVSKPSRMLILREIDSWEESGLLERFRAEVIRRRYDFDILTSTTVKQPAKEKIEPVKKVEIAQAEPQPFVASATQSPLVVPTTRAPLAAPSRPSLMQTLLSEFSVRIYLYLGAFFVIAAAAILAALVEVARLPVLLIATFAFFAAALGFKKRLPQPSFAFAIVFSFLLPIDGVVLADTLQLQGQSADYWYWFLLNLIMAGFWAGGTWLYESRLFSVASFVAFTFGLVQFNSAIDAPTEWVFAGVGVASLVGMFAAKYLKHWKDTSFITPLFTLTQITQGLSLLLGFGLTGTGLIDGASTIQWLGLAVIWLVAGAFYALSNRVISLILFPWASVVALMPVAWLTLNAFKAVSLVHGVGFVFWGTCFALLSEFAFRAKSDEPRKYHYPLLTASLPLFLVAVLWGFVESISYGFGALLATGIAYSIPNVMRARWYVWTVSLLSLLGAFFTFFQLPFMENVNVFVGYQFMIASTLLLLPELFFKQPLALSRSWNWPPVALGIVVSGFTLLIAHIYLFSETIYFGYAAVILGVFAVLFAAYALRFKMPLIGYFGTASLALTIVYALAYFVRDLWLPSLAVLTAIYYAAGYFLARKEQTRSWSTMLIQSALALGLIVSVVSLALLKAISGWFVLGIAIVFTLEFFTRRVGYLEFFVATLVNTAAILLLNDFNVTELAYYLLVSSLVWLSVDILLHLTFKERKVHLVTRLIAGMATLLAMILITDSLASSQTSICFAAYSAFFAAYALLYKQPRLGYLATASASWALLYALNHFEVNAWFPIVTIMALAYFTAGYLLKSRSVGWSDTLRYSGLALGSIATFFAVVSIEDLVSWSAFLVGVAFVVETVTSRDSRFEAGVHIQFSAAAYLLLNDLGIHELSYILLAISFVWLAGDIAFLNILKERKIKFPAQVIPLLLTLVNALIIFSETNARIGMIVFGAYTVLYVVYSILRANPSTGYLSTVSLPLAVYYGMQYADRSGWIFPVIAVVALYYLGGRLLDRSGKSPAWSTLLINSGLGLGGITALLSPMQLGGAENALPIAIAATLYAAEAFTRRNVWWAFPANTLYLISYFTLLIKLNVDELQYFSIGAALLGMLMHYLLVRAKSKAGAFIMGMASQLVLLGTTYIQMMLSGQLGFFFVLFLQSLVILVYGIVMRSRSLVIAPIGFSVLATVTVLYSALKGISVVVVVGVAGIILLTLGVLAVLLRERISMLAERFGDWSA